MGDFGGVVTIVVAVLALVGGVITARSSSTTELVKRVRTLENNYRVLTDYVHTLRADLVEAGVKPRPWPDQLKI